MYISCKASGNRRAQHRHTVPVIFALICWACSALYTQAWADTRPKLPPKPVRSAPAKATKTAPPPQPKDESSDSEARERTWFLYWGQSNSYPALSGAAKQIEGQVNKPFRTLAPGFSDVRTFKDQADDCLIWSPIIGAGYLLSDRWDVFFQTGYAAGKVRTKADDTSILLLPLHSDVEFHRSNFFAGVGTDYYPWGMVEPGEYKGIKERLKGARPFIAPALSWNYLTFEGEVKARLKPFPNLVNKKQDDSWSPWSVGLSVGFDIPTTKNSSLSILTTYNKFLDQSDDFSGPSITMFWKRYF